MYEFLYSGLKFGFKLGHNSKAGLNLDVYQLNQNKSFVFKKLQKRD